MEMWVIWLIIMAVLMLIELFSQMLWAACLSVGCAVGLVVSIFEVPVFWQIIIASVVALLAYIILVPLFQKMHAISAGRPDKNARTGMDALLGRTAIMTEEARPDRPGRVRIDGDNWQVKCVGSQNLIPRGTQVRVTGYDSILLEVEPIETL